MATGDASTKSDSLRDDLRTTVQALSAAVQALTQATQVLRATTSMMVQSMQQPGAAGVGPRPGAAVAQINVWEDDPFSEASPTENPVAQPTIGEAAPPVVIQGLRWQIAEAQSEPAQRAPGTPEFRFWNAESALTRCAGFWAPVLPQGTRWSTLAPVLPVTLVAGQWLNALYRRIDGLQFFRDSVKGRDIFSGESPDVVCHEMGHAVLDAIRPELFHAASTETSAFHEAFGDMSSMLVSMQLPSLRAKILGDTNGRLNVNSRLSRVAEQLGWALRQRSPDSVDVDCLRNAANRFFYHSPSTLPSRAPANLLSTEAHSFARVFTGAFLDALAAMLSLNGPPTDAQLEAVSRDMRQLLVDGILTAPIAPEYFSQVAAAMVQAATARNNGRYRPVLLRVFVERGILSLQAGGNLETAPVPNVLPVGAPAGPYPGMGIAPLEFGTPSGSPTLLAFGESVARGFQSEGATAPSLPLLQVSAEFLETPILVHAPDESSPFAVASAALGGSRNAPYAPSAADVAREFVGDLIQRGRLQPGNAKGIVANMAPARTDRYSHTLEQTDKGVVLKRLHFDCGLCDHDHPLA
jgi:hypothetical protein